MKRICVYCGSSPGARSEYTLAAEALGRALAVRKIGLVYGGACVGLMGRAADACLEAGGEVIGVIPKRFEQKELAHAGLTRLHIVNTMHERKSMMAGLADGFIALPGGIGTLEEFFEALTWTQIGIHRKPCGLVNVCGFYDPLMVFVDRLVEEQFLRAEHRDMIQIDASPEALVDRLVAVRMPESDKAAWVRQMSSAASKNTPPASA